MKTLIQTYHYLFVTVYLTSSYPQRIMVVKSWLHGPGSWIYSGQVSDQFWTVGHQSPGSMMWLSSATLSQISPISPTHRTLRLRWVGPDMCFMDLFLVQNNYNFSCFFCLRCVLILKHRAFLTVYLVMSVTRVCVCVRVLTVHPAGDGNQNL